MQRMLEIKFSSVKQAEEVHKKSLVEMEALDKLPEDVFLDRPNEEDYRKWNRRRQAASIYLGKHRKKGK